MDDGGKKNHGSLASQTIERWQSVGVFSAEGVCVSLSIGSKYSTLHLLDAVPSHQHGSIHLDSVMSPQIV